jgi:hypothetical protein
VFSSCATDRRSGLEGGDVISTMTAKEAEALKKEAKSLWAKRHLKEELEKSIAVWEKLSRTDQADRETFQALTHGYYLLADAHEEDVEIKKVLWEKGAMFGEKAMAMNPKFQEMISSKKSVEEALSALEKADAAGIYWTDANLGKWAKLSGIATQLKYKGRIKALIETVEKLDPTFFHGAVARYWGAFYAVAPSFAGGDLNKSKKSFELSLQQAPQYLGTKVLMAEVYYTKKQDKKAFEKTLQEVLATADNVYPALMPENVIEKRKAQNLLKKIDELF